MAELLFVFKKFLHFFFFPFFVLSFFLYFFLSQFRLDELKESPADLGTHLLVVTAHPDDECMFFSPTILHFQRKKKNISILCLSNGNFYNLGNKRQVELVKSCRVLGIAEKNVKIINSSCFPDDPSRIWNEELVARTILEHIEEIHPDVVLTFDRYGITGHNNHISVYHGCRKIFSEGRAPHGVSFVSLETTNGFRKYISFLDIPLSLVYSWRFCISSIKEVICAQQAMFSHWTQLTWYRSLYIFFSRYMLINTLGVHQNAEDFSR